MGLWILGVEKKLGPGPILGFEKRLAGVPLAIYS